MNRLIGYNSLLLLALMAAACAPSAQSPTAIAGTYRTVLTEEALRDAGAGFAIVTGLQDAEFIMQFKDDGTYQASEVTDIGVRPRSKGDFELTADRFVFLKDEGEMTCSAGGVDRGTYSWALNGDQLTFTLVEDECEDRVYIMTALPWMRTP